MGDHKAGRDGRNGLCDNALVHQALQHAFVFRPGLDEDIALGEVVFGEGEIDCAGCKAFAVCWLVLGVNQSKAPVDRLDSIHSQQYAVVLGIALKHNCCVGLVEELGLEVNTPGVGSLWKIAGLVSYNF